MSNSKTRHIQECNNNIEKRFLNERASDLRNYMGKVGWKEKGTELSSGGDITDELSNIMNDLMYSATSLYKCTGTFTAGNDKFHKTRKSRHTTGQAVDVVMDSSCHKNFIDLLNIFVKKYPGFSYIDEYKNPSKGSTGGHFHISYNKGNPETGPSNDFDSSTTTTASTEGDDNSKKGAEIMKSILQGGI